MNRILRILAACPAIFLIQGSVAVDAHAQQAPNVIVIISDDAGYADFGFMNGLSGSSSVVPTPNLDALANRGVTFSRAYVAANCQPTRAALVTGGYQQRIGNESVGNNLFLPVDDPSIAQTGFEGVPVETETIWDRMKSQGYTTGAVGKWHLGQHANSSDGQVLGNRPENQGVDEFYGHWHGSRDYTVGSYNLNQINNPTSGLQTRYLRETVVDPQGNVTDTVVEGVHSGEYITNTFGDYGVNFIKNHHDDSNPFFLYQSFTAPHEPWDEASPAESNPVFLAAIADKNLSDTRKRVAGMMYTMDQEIGRMMEALEDPDGDGNTSDSIADNTMVVFLNDNGGINRNPKGTDNGALNRWKGSPLEGGIRVPMIIAGAGIDPSKANTVYDKPVHGIDVLPTAFSLAGGQFAPDEDKIDGISLLPFINGTDTSNPHDVLVHRWRGNFAVIKGDWKLVNRRNDDSSPTHYELYNVSTDVGESNDVIGSSAHAALVAELKRELTKHEAFFDKPRYAILSNSVESQPINLFDHFVWRPGATTNPDWSGGPLTYVQGPANGKKDDYYVGDNNWYEAGTTNEEFLLATDAFAGAILEFPTADVNYTSNNDLLRQTGMEFMLNKIILSKDFNNAADRSATIQGNKLLFTKDLDQVGPQIAIEANSIGSGKFSYDIDLDVIMYHDLTITGDGDTTLTINGEVGEYFEHRSLTKSGNSTAVLTADNSYEGDTRVEAGTLSITNAYLTDASDVYLTTGANFNLDFTDIDTIDSLFIDGTSQAVGTWGAIGSGANNETALITGTGMLSVSTLAALSGDFDNDGDVDGADFLKFQREDGSANGLAAFQANYGDHASTTASSVPEPAGLAILLSAIVALMGVRADLKLAKISGLNR
ncbi:sulfatase-like hydrolase/transferase [Adhaeretor mobilis]|uniref:Arylsulfatase n=1 Tax=Adhaeretor mobilis TaxID=1930276 RepID=A0A517MUE5_9BACT|nr:sulfatase-like hydrolase/transferase [Adhaeretor mobilis]QDS98505.1 Arylsulfatase [Adhaeretor mobilis]